MRFPEREVRRSIFCFAVRLIGTRSNEPSQGYLFFVDIPQSNFGYQFGRDLFRALLYILQFPFLKPRYASKNQSSQWIEHLSRVCDFTYLSCRLKRFIFSRFPILDLLMKFITNASYSCK